MRRVLVSLTSAALVVAGAFALASRPEPTAFGPVKLVPPIYAGTQPGIDYVVRRSGWSAGFGGRGLALSLPQGDGTTAGVAWRLAGAGQATPAPQDRLPTLVTEYDGVHERVGLPSWSAVRWARALPEADLVLRSRERDLEWSVEFERGADRRRVTVEVEGVDAARLEGRELRLQVGRGELVESGLACRQAEPVACRYTGIERVREGLWRYEIEAEGLDPAHGLVVDPGLTWAVTVSGDAADFARAVSPFDDQSFVVVGGTWSSFMPGAGSRTPGGIHGYLLRIGGAAGAPVGLSALYIDGVATAPTGDPDPAEGFHDVVSIGQGRVLVTGRTSTEGLDSTGNSTLSGNQHDAFVAEIALDGAGPALKKARFRYLGSTKGAGYKLAVGTSGAIAVGGQAVRPNETKFESVVWLLEPDFDQKWKYALFPLSTEKITGIAVTEPTIHVVGNGTGGQVISNLTLPGLLGPNAPRPVPAPTRTGWMLGLDQSDSTGQREVYFSWIGGAGNITNLNALLVRNRMLYLAGETLSPTFCNQTASADKMGVIDDDFQTTPGDTEGFVLAVTSTAADWRKDWSQSWCTYFGSDMAERIYSLGWNPRSNNLLLVGALTPPAGGPSGFPGVQDKPVVFGLDDVFATELTVSGAKQMAWTRVFGGVERDFGMALSSTRVPATPDASFPVVLVGNTMGEFHSSGTTLGYDGGVGGVNTANSTLNLFVVAADLTPPLLPDASVQDGLEKSDLDEFKGAAKASWVAFPDPEDPTVTYEVAFANGSYCTEAADLVMPFQKATGLTHVYQSADAGLVHGTRYFAVVKGSNSSGLSTIACSNGAVYDPLDGGVGLDAGPKRDTGTTALPDTGTEELPDTGVATMDAAATGSDAGRPDAALVASDAGDDGKQPVLGWGCGCGATGGVTPLFGLLLLLGLRRRR